MELTGVLLVSLILGAVWSVGLVACIIALISWWQKGDIFKNPESRKFIYFLFSIPAFMFLAAILVIILIAVKQP
jgi:bacteriorhodopsin